MLLDRKLFVNCINRQEFERKRGGSVAYPMQSFEISFNVTIICATAYYVNYLYLYF